MAPNKGEPLKKSVPTTEPLPPRKKSETLSRVSGVDLNAKDKRKTLPTPTARKGSKKKSKGVGSITSKEDATSQTSSISDGPATVSVVIVNEDNSIPNIPITGKETEQDLVDRYNEYYRHHKQKQKKGVLAGDSVSSTAITHSQLIHSRACRLVIFRRLLMFCCLLLWCFSLLFAGFWFMTMYVWPKQFTLTEHAKEYYGVDIDKPTISYPMLGITVLHCGIVGAWGLISATCGQEKCLKRFMLTAPWFLIISCCCGFVAVKFVGDLSQEKLARTMLRHQGFYHHPESKKNESKTGWDTVQLFLRCCGIESPDEWVKVNHDENEKVPASCCMNGKGRRETDETEINHCIYDEELLHVFPVGCREKIFDFVTHIGAGVTATCFSVTFIIILAVIFAHKFFVLKKKIRIGHYNYPLKEFLIDFTYSRKCVTLYRKRKAKRSHKAKVAAGGVVKDEDEMSLDEYDLYAAMEDAVKKEEAEIAAKLDVEHQEYMADKKNRKGRKMSILASHNGRAANEGRGKKNVSLLYRKKDGDEDDEDDEEEDQEGGLLGPERRKSMAIPVTL